MDPFNPTVDPDAPCGRTLRDHAEEQKHDIESRSLEAAGWPSSLIKAVFDPFEYTAGVQGLGVIEFESARVDSPGWVHLISPHTSEVVGPNPAHAAHWQRGIDVRLSAILWVADGGH